MVSATVQLSQEKPTQKSLTTLISFLHFVRAFLESECGSLPLGLLSTSGFMNLNDGSSRVTTESDSIVDAPEKSSGRDLSCPTGYPIVPHSCMFLWVLSSELKTHTVPSVHFRVMQQQRNLILNPCCVINSYTCACERGDMPNTPTELRSKASSNLFSISALQYTHVMLTASVDVLCFPQSL